MCGFGVITNRRKKSFRFAKGWAFLFAIGCLTWAASSLAGDFCLESVGVRGGFSSDARGDDFYMVEAIVNCNLPWRWDLGADFGLQTGLNFSAGTLGDDTQNAFMGTVGPSLLLDYRNWPISLEGGSSPTLLSQSTFGPKDYGTVFQFTSYIGLNWDFARHWRLGYDFQHMSNAHLADHNPGLNM